MKKIFFYTITVSLFIFLMSCASDNSGYPQSTSSVKTEIMKGVFMYESQNGVDSVIYYSDNDRIMELDKNDFLLKQVGVFKKMKLKIPKTWVYNSDNSTKDFTIFVKENVKEKEFVPSVSIQRFAKDSFNIDEFGKYYISGFSQNYKNFMMHNLSKNPINNILISRQVNYSFTVNEKRMSGISVFYEIGEYFYLFEGLCPNNKEYERMKYIPTYQLCFTSASEHINPIR